jgi:hypothetical protein
MTVEELIEKLNTIKDKNIRVVVRGCKGGYDDIEWPVGKDSPNVMDLALYVNPDWFCGDHEIVSEDHQYGENVQIVKAIIL